MATAPDKPLDTTKVHTFRLYKDDDVEWNSMQDLIFQEDTSYKCPTYIHKTAPCQGSCPSGEDIRGWLQIVRGIEKPPTDMSMQEYAFRRSTRANPFPSMMGRVCPAPCEEGCNRNDVDDFVGINSVEQYIGDTAIENGFAFNPPEAMSGKKIAIVGGGVAGLSAAYQLRMMGHGSTIFDDHEHLGGMARYGIPAYRVPRDQLDAEIGRITTMEGVEVKTSTRIGRDVTVESLETDYDAILWTLGCKNGRGLFVDNWNDVPNAVPAVNFLEVFNSGNMHYTAPKIVCVGGGDTSIDVVSVSRRIGTLADYSDLPEDVVMGRTVHAENPSEKLATEVTLTSLFPQDQMTAAEHEVNDALIEGVTILNEVMPVEILVDENGRGVALKVVECIMEGSLPKAKEGGKETIIEADLIVSAIGQFGSLEGLEEFDNGRSLIDSDQFYQVPNKPGHFVAGDIVRPHLLTTAIGQASIAAESINHYLNNRDQVKRPKVDKHHFDLLDKLRETALSPESYEETKAEDLRGTETANFAVHNYDDRSEHQIVPSSDLFLGHFKQVGRNLRTEEVPSSTEVIGHFMERVNALAEEEVVAEAGRCMSCGMCFECDNCVIYCPQDAVFRVNKKQSTMGRYVDTDYDKCIGCHICADVCPTGYIEMGLGG